ncbi:MAG TPA: hypothetical protein VJ959_03565 [Desulfotignum sp.]|nr:hypothetical protein [Desulfotignum sp.]
MNTQMFQNRKKDQKELDEIFPETLKNRFLAAIFQKDRQAAGQVYHTIVDQALLTQQPVPENTEKILRQIQTAFRRFRPFLVPEENRLSDLYTDLNRRLACMAGSAGKKVCRVGFADWKNRMDLLPWQMDKVWETAITVQLTSGCSNFCRRCNEWALPGIRAHFSYAAARQMLHLLVAHNNTDAALYGASDPLDWEDGTRTLADLLIPFCPGTNFSLLTKVPRTRDQVFKKLVHHGVGLSVSVTAANRNRITALENQTGIRLQKQHDSDDLLIPAGLDEDFTTVKSSITDAYGTEITPEGVFIIIPTFTTALHPMGHKKIPVTGNTRFFPKKKIGRQALLVDYFKPLEVVKEKNLPCHLSFLLDIQVETLLLDNGSLDLSPPGMRNLKEYFTIFEETARLRRKQMTRSVIRGLKKQFFSDSRYKDLDTAQKRQYRHKIAVHRDFCKKTTVTTSRISAAAFFLRSARDYLAANADKTAIIAHLITPEADLLEHRYGRIASASEPEELFFRASCDFFGVFRFYATALVFGRHKQAADRFIQTHPAIYDPVADRFMPHR